MNRINMLKKLPESKNWHNLCLVLGMNKSPIIFTLLTLSLLLGSMGCGAGSSAGSASEAGSTVLAGAGNTGLAPGLPPLSSQDPGEPSGLLSYLAIRVPMRMGYGVPQDHFSMTAGDFLKLLEAFQARLDADKSHTVLWMAPDFESRLALDLTQIGRPELEPTTAEGTFACDLQIRVYDAGKLGKKIDTSFGGFENLEREAILNQYPNLVENAGLNWSVALATLDRSARLYFICDRPMPGTPQAAI